MGPHQQGRSTKPISKPVTIAELSLSDKTDITYGPVKFHVLKERLEPQATLEPKVMESLQDPEEPVRSKV